MNISVETERLLLREILITDVDGMFELDSDPEVHKYLGNQPLTSKNQTIDIINFIRQQYIDYGIGRWTMIEKGTGNFIGWAGLKFVTTLTNKHINYYDLGYRLIQRYWRKGFATEAAIASLVYAFDQLQVNEVYASADCENAGSNKILRKIGMNLIETYYYEDIQCNWYKIDKNEYHKLKESIKI